MSIHCLLPSFLPSFCIRAVTQAQTIQGTVLLSVSNA